MDGRNSFFSYSFSYQHKSEQPVKLILLPFSGALRINLRLNKLLDVAAIKISRFSKVASLMIQSLQS